MLKRGFWSSYLMATVGLLGAAISYLALTTIRRGTAVASGLTTEVPASAWVLFCLSLLVLPSVPALLIRARDASHFGVSGMARWMIVGALTGSIGAILAEVLPSAGRTSPALVGLAAFTFRIVVGLGVVLMSYWVVFPLPRLVSSALGKRRA